MYFYVNWLLPTYRFGLRVCVCTYTLTENIYVYIYVCMHLNELPVKLVNFIIFCECTFISLYKIYKNWN